MRHTWKKKIGFSLVELMIVLSIIGIITGLSLPKFKMMQAKARQQEAKINLRHLDTLQQAYHSEKEYYINFGGSTCLNAYCPPLSLAIGRYTTSATHVHFRRCDYDNVLGFKLTDCEKVNYTYWIMQAYPTTYSATATSTRDPGILGGSNVQYGENYVMPGCTISDTWAVNETGRVTSNNAIKSCY